MLYHDIKISQKYPTSRKLGFIFNYLHTIFYLGA